MQKQEKQEKQTTTTPPPPTTTTIPVIQPKEEQRKLSEEEIEEKDKKTLLLFYNLASQVKMNLKQMVNFWVNEFEKDVNSPVFPYLYHIVNRIHPFYSLMSEARAHSDKMRKTGTFKKWRKMNDRERIKWTKETGAFMRKNESISPEEKKLVEYMQKFYEERANKENEKLNADLEKAKKEITELTSKMKNMTREELDLYYKNSFMNIHTNQTVEDVTSNIKEKDNNVTSNTNISDISQSTSSNGNASDISQSTSLNGNVSDIVEK